MKNMRKKKRRENGSYTDETSAGGDKEGFGYFSSRIPTITSESAIHLSTNLITGTFPSGFASRNLKTP